MVGTDIIKIDRIRRARKKYGEAFMKFFFTKDELSQRPFFSDATLAGMIAAKEAFAKATGLGFKENILTWHSIQVMNDSNGAPYIFHPSASILSRMTHLSISHDSDTAIAVVVIQKE